MTTSSARDKTEMEINMKTAICLHGLARGSTTKADGAYKERFATLLSKIGDADVFIHSWDIDISEELVEIFNPISYKIEHQKNFSEELDKLKHMNKSNNTWENQYPLFNILSFLYSRKYSVDLKRQHEIENKIKYDCVLICRFDVGFHNSGRNKTSYLDFNLNLDMSKVYQAYWNQTNAGSSDHWYYSNSDNIDTISTIYDKMFEYLQPNSNYTYLCKTGWPISNKHDKFSNELLKEDRSTDLAIYVSNDTVLINPHCLYKYHLMFNGLWDNGKSVFLNKDLFCSDYL